MDQDKFISEEIVVARDDDRQEPISFSWDGKDFCVREIIAVWSDYGFSSGAPRKKNWRMRRHRTCYRVETTDGAVYEIYHDRGIKAGGGKWYLLAQVKPPDSENG